MYYHKFLKDHRGRIKPKAVKAQGTSTSRSCYTVVQQFRWHNLVEEGLNFLSEHNTGRCKKYGKTFGEVIDHFVVGYDEANMIANAGEFGLRKHEKMVSDCQTSCTLGRSGSAAGDNGPTSFIMAGQRAASGYNTKMLLDNGCCNGSGLYMTENAFLTDKCWLETTPNVIRGYPNMPYIKANKDWWMMEIVDSYGSHLSSLRACQQRWDAKILLVKEEGDSSSVN